MTIMIAKGTPHSCHQGFAESIGAQQVVIEPDPFVLSGSVVEMVRDGLRIPTSMPDDGVFLIEHANCLAASPRIRHQYPDATILYLFAQGELFTDRYHYGRSSLTKQVIRRANTLAERELGFALIRKYVDGIVANSELMANRIENVTQSRIPVEIAQPYISDDLYESLASITPALDQPTAVVIGSDDDWKGVDLIVNSWGVVRDQHPDATLLIAGKGCEGYDEPGVTGLGYVPDVGKVFERASVCIHPARLEAFGVSVVEAMRAGLPTIVTEGTGSKSVVKSVDDSFIVSAAPADLAQRTITYFNTTHSKRESLSQRFRNASSPFSRVQSWQQFRNAVTTLTPNQSNFDSNVNV